MEYNFTDHSLEKGIERGITGNMIKAVIKKPDKTLPGNQPGVKRAIKTLGKYTYTVVWRKRNKLFHVITVYKNEAF